MNHQNDPLAKIRIILVEPAGPLNIGSVARVMKNMGLSQLILVNPHCDPLGEEARKMAIHAADILEMAQIVTSIPDALQGCQRAIATTARTRSSDIPLEHPRTSLPWLLAAPSALIFGPEDRGLNNEELNYAQRFVRIPSTEAYPSLNLAQAVAVCCYELAQSVPVEKKSEDVVAEAGSSNPAQLDILEGYYQHLESVLLKIGYLYPHTAASRMEKFRRLYHRAQLDESDVAMLRGILRQIEWAITQPRLVDDTLKSSNESSEDRPSYKRDSS